MGVRAVKQEILQMVAAEDALPRVFTRLADYDDKEAVNALFSAICRDEPLLRWRAISCMGVCVARLATKEMEEGRIIMRRLLWSLNDESGGIGWGAPESMAEIMCRHQGLAEEYSHMLLSYLREDGEELFQDGNFIEHPLLRRAVVWGMARLCGCCSELMRRKGAPRDIAPLLAADDAFICACAALAAGALHAREMKPEIQNLCDNDTAITLYWNEALSQTTVAAVAKAVLRQMEE